MSDYRTQTLVGDQPLAWANSAAQNTEKTLDLSAVNYQAVGSKLLIIVRNPSTVTALTGALLVKYSDGATTRYARLGSTFTVASANGDGEAFLLDGGILAAGARLSLKNATVLGGADAFSARAQAFAL